MPLALDLASLMIRLAGLIPEGHIARRLVIVLASVGDNEVGRRQRPIEFKVEHKNKPTWRPFGRIANARAPRELDTKPAAPPLSYSRQSAAKVGNTHMEQDAA